MKIAAGLVEAQSGEVFRIPPPQSAIWNRPPDFAGYNTVQAYCERALDRGMTPIA